MPNLAPGCSENNLPCLIGRCCNFRSLRDEFLCRTNTSTAQQEENDYVMCKLLSAGILRYQSRVLGQHKHKSGR